MVEATVATEIPPGLILALREAVRAELQAALPQLRAGPALLTVRECAKKYRKGYDSIRRLINRGELMALERPANCGGVQWMVVAADAERKLGGTVG